MRGRALIGGLALASLSSLVGGDVGRAQQAASERALYSPPGPLTGAAVNALRKKNLWPFSRNTAAIASAIRTLEANGKLSDSSKAKLSLALGQEATVASIDRSAKIRALDPSALPSDFFESLAGALTDEELAAVLNRSKGFELERPPKPGDLEPGTSESDLSTLLPKWNPTGQVVEGTDVPSKLPGTPTLESLASQRGLWGVTESKETIEDCSGVASKFNAALELASSNPLDAPAQLSKNELGKKVAASCFHSITAPAPDELKTFGLLEYPDGSLRCAAVLRNANTIVTARHCLFKEEDGDRRVPSWAFISFRPWIDPDRKIELKDVRVPADVPATLTDEFEAINDVVEATLTASVTGIPSICWAAVTAPKQPLGLFGLLPESPAPVGSGWTGHIMAATAGTCVAEKASDTCFVHFCNAVPRFSGGPLFGAPNATCPAGVRVLGLHLAASGKSAGCSTQGGNDAIAGTRVAQLLNLSTM